MFLYKELLGRALEWLYNVERAKRPARVPVVLTEAEVRTVLAQMDVRHALMAGTSTVRAQAHGVRAPAGQGCRLRVFPDHRPRTILPALLPANLLAHLERVKAVHQKDIEEGFGEVYLPFALARARQKRF